MNERFIRRTQDGFVDVISAIIWARQFFFDELRTARDVQIVVEQVRGEREPDTWSATVIGTISETREG